VVTQARRALGQKGEAAARAYLERHGVRILAANYTCPAGEIDLVGQERDGILFIEVKTRTSAAFGPAQGAVHHRKQQQIVRTAEWFLAERRLRDVACRFDVVAVTVLDDGELPRIDWVRDAFPAEGVRVW
jgi:putative endonuclease